MSYAKNPNKKSVDKLIAQHKKHQKKLSAKTLIPQILKGNKTALSEAITILESAQAKHQQIASEILQQALPHTGKSIRIGITGVPGVGKSTFIESFGLYLIEQGKKVAVLAIDPSSEKSKGSILGDKTRMNNLAIQENAFIRPSSSRGSLGGVAQNTRESILLCEAAGFDVILVETVGVGQSEIAVHSMTDFFLLLMLAGAGDELQGIKRGIIEMADALVITKTDGKNIAASNLARSQYKSALHLFPVNKNNWLPQVETISALENKGIDKVWKIVQDFETKTKANGHFEINRNEQQLYWMHESVKEKILNEFYQNESTKKIIDKVSKELLTGKITSQEGAKKIISSHGKKKL